MTARSNIRLFHDPETPRGLLTATLARIELATRRAASLRLAALGVVMLFSGTSLISAVNYTVHEFYASGFYDYLSLVFSDGSVALSHWQEISLSLEESLPSIALLLLAVVGAVFLWSLRFAMRDIKVVFRPRIA